MFRFSIRDVLWLTVVVAMGLGWWLDHWHADRVRRFDRENIRIIISSAKHNKERYDRGTRKLEEALRELQKERRSEPNP